MLCKIFTYVFAKRKMLTLRHFMLRYVRVENRHKSTRYVFYCVVLHVFYVHLSHLNKDYLLRGPAYLRMMVMMN